ncbi:uncharacterized protein LOC109510950 [Hippocampus comes]|uniref:uncharacterized protein LOC109510950 n=1 Tax=Hippocampus comes TaxID=109280 RepID=UPI00094E9F20|nr:PREDICTED: uncharacterized protein LOC109510950 [Hippocampus comes]
MERSNHGSSRWSRLTFNGDEKHYELWETTFLAYLRLQGLKETILSENPQFVDVDEEAKDKEQNGMAYAELIQFLDDKSLGLVMREAADDGRKALKMLREYYAGKGKPRLINLYSELTSLQMGSKESVTDFVIRAETIITALRNAEEVMSDDLLIAMVLKGLPESFKPFAVHVTQSEEKLKFADFKTRLRPYEDAEKLCAQVSDNVMKVNVKDNTPRGDNKNKMADMVCFKCGEKGHKARGCQRRQWCSYCNSSTHRDANCRRRPKSEQARQAAQGEGNKSYAFLTKDREADIVPRCRVKMKGLMVDTGATSHIITDETKFKSFDETFKADTHYVGRGDPHRQQRTPPYSNVEEYTVHPFISTGHFLCQGCDGKWSNSDFQRRKGHGENE